MTSVPAKPRWWMAAIRWGVAVALVCAGQAVLVLLLEKRDVVIPRKANDAPRALISGGQLDEWLALQNPTLFVLPHRANFSGGAWLKIRPMEYSPEEWSESVKYLNPQTNALGAGFPNFLASTAFPTFQTIRVPEPELRLPEGDLSLPPPALPVLRIEGGLANRRLLSRFEMPVQIHADSVKETLSNSVVQLLVDARGNTVSAVLLEHSNSTNADSSALELARAARFVPLKTAGPRVTKPWGGLTLGTMLFEWRPARALPETP